MMADVLPQLRVGGATLVVSVAAGVTIAAYEAAFPASAIVRTILALAQSLDLHVVAEGVESVGQLSFLRLHGCTGFQGYLFGRPAPLESWDELLFLDLQDNVA